MTETCTILAHLVRVSANIIAGDGDCSASRFEGKPSRRVGSVRRTYGIEIDVNFFIILTR